MVVKIITPDICGRENGNPVKDAQVDKISMDIVISSVFSLKNALTIRAPFTKYARVKRLKPFACSFCQFVFSSVDRLKRHSERHRRKYLKQVSCRKTYPKRKKRDELIQKALKTPVQVILIKQTLKNLLKLATFNNTIKEHCESEHYHHQEQELVSDNINSICEKENCVMHTSNDTISKAEQEGIVKRYRKILMIQKRANRVKRKYFQMRAIRHSSCAPGKTTKQHGLAQNTLRSKHVTTQTEPEKRILGRRNKRIKLKQRKMLQVVKRANRVKKKYFNTVIRLSPTTTTKKTKQSGEKPKQCGLVKNSMKTVDETNQTRSATRQLGNPKQTLITRHVKFSKTITVHRYRQKKLLTSCRTPNHSSNDIPRHSASVLFKTNRVENKELLETFQIDMNRAVSRKRKLETFQLQTNQSVSNKRKWADYNNNITRLCDCSKKPNLLTNSSDITTSSTTGTHNHLNTNINPSTRDLEDKLQQRNDLKRKRRKKMQKAAKHPMKALKTSANQNVDILNKDQKQFNNESTRYCVCFKKSNERFHSKGKVAPDNQLSTFIKRPTHNSAKKPKHGCDQTQKQNLKTTYQKTKQTGCKKSNLNHGDSKVIRYCKCSEKSRLCRYCGGQRNQNPTCKRQVPVSAENRTCSNLQQSVKHSARNTHSSMKQALNKPQAILKERIPDCSRKKNPYDKKTTRNCERSNSSQCHSKCAEKPTSDNKQPQQGNKHSSCNITKQDKWMQNSLTSRKEATPTCPQMGKLTSCDDKTTRQSSRLCSKCGGKKIRSDQHYPRKRIKHCVPSQKSKEAQYDHLKNVQRTKTQDGTGKKRTSKSNNGIARHCVYLRKTDCGRKVSETDQTNLSVRKSCTTDNGVNGTRIQLSGQCCTKPTTKEDSPMTGSCQKPVPRNKHRKNLPKKRPFQCEFCHKWFVTNSDLTIHRQIHKTPTTVYTKRYQCDHCQKCFAKRGVLKCHMTTHTDEQFRCQYCHAIFSKEDDLYEHMKCHIRITIENYKCKYCHKMFVSKNDLQRHTRLHRTKEKPFQCEQCRAGFSRRDTLARHVRYRHIKNKSNQCMYCLKYFASTKYLKIHHSRIHTKENPFQCEVSQTLFVRKDELVRQAKIHTNERTFQCKYCQKCFLTKQNLSFHLSTHSCKTADKCQKTLKRGDERKINTNTEEKPFSCKDCKRRFSIEQNLYIHQIHWHNEGTGQKTHFRCDYCHECFSHKSDLKTHLENHIREKSFTCKICQKTFTQSWDLNRHIGTHKKAEIKSLIT